MVHFQPEVGKSLEHYIMDVMKEAKLCKYGNLIDEPIRDRLVSDDQIHDTTESNRNPKCQPNHSVTTSYQQGLCQSWERMPA